MPHSQFLGWGDIDQAKAIAYERWLSDHCHACGQRRSDWHDENGKELRDPPFEIVSMVCSSCEVLGDWQEERQGSKHKRHGVYPAFRRLPE